MQIILTTGMDFSFTETLTAHGWRCLAPFLWDEDTQTLEHTQEMDGGAVVRLRLHASEGRLTIDADDSGHEHKAEIARRVRRMLQLDLPLDFFHAYCRTRLELGHIAECRRGRMLRCPTLFEDAVKVIATVNTTWAQTIAMTARLVEHFGAPLAADPARHAFPTPQRLATVPFDEFAAQARMGYRNAYVHSLATSIAEGRLDLEGMQDAGLAAGGLRKKLLALPGIGPYGAACLMLYLGKPEHVNSDSVARAALSRELGRAVTDKEVLAFFEGHGEWRGLVYNFYPWKEDAP